MINANVLTAILIDFAYIYVSNDFTALQAISASFLL